MPAIEGIAGPLEIDELYEGEILSLVPYGAFVRIRGRDAWLSHPHRPRFVIQAHGSGFAAPDSRSRLSGALLAWTVMPPARLADALVRQGPRVSPAITAAC